MRIRWQFETRFATASLLFSDEGTFWRSIFLILGDAKSILHLAELFHLLCWQWQRNRKFKMHWKLMMQHGMGSVCVWFCADIEHEHWLWGLRFVDISAPAACKNPKFSILQSRQFPHHKLFNYWILPASCQLQRMWSTTSKCTRGCEFSDGFLRCCWSN